MTLKTIDTTSELCFFLINIICCLCTDQLHTAMKESSPLFDDGQPWGEETEDGIMYNKVTLITINIILQ